MKAADYDVKVGIINSESPERASSQSPGLSGVLCRSTLGIRSIQSLP
jgi:hypothetical protein